MVLKKNFKLSKKYKEILEEVKIGVDDAQNFAHRFKKNPLLFNNYPK